jgi:hypothetical protein
MQNQEFYFSTGVFIRNLMCLARFGTQTTVVMGMAYTVPKRSNPGRAYGIPVPFGSNLLSIAPEPDERRLSELVFLNYGFNTIIISASALMLPKSHDGGSGDYGDIAAGEHATGRREGCGLRIRSEDRRWNLPGDFPGRRHPGNGVEQPATILQRQS